MASTNPFASLIDKSIAPVVGASGDVNPFLKPPGVSGAASGALSSGAASEALGSDTLSDGSWTDDEVDPSSFKPLMTRGRSRARPISIIKRSLTRKRINNPDSQVGMQCLQGKDGKYYYVSFDPYNPSHLEIIDKLSPLLVNPTPREFQKGALYTYIFASIITKNPDTGADVQLVPPKLYACRAQNNFELGTKHHHIFFRMALIKELASVAQANGIDENKVEYGLYASGEIKCITPTKLMVNFFSGTYKMKRKIKIPKFPKSRKGVPYEIDDIKKLMRQIDINYKIKYNPAPFITSDLSITREQLDFLESNGFPTFGFNTERQCYDMKIHIMRAKNVEKRTLGLEEMKRIHAEILHPRPAPPPTNAYLLTSAQLKDYAHDNKLTVPEPPYDTETKNAVRQIVQSHMDANKGKGGGKKGTLKKKRTMKKKRTLKK